MRHLLFFNFFLLFVAAAQGQNVIINPQYQYPVNKLYHRIALGYNFNAGYDATYQIVENKGGTSTQTLIPMSYGKGLNLNYGIGYMFHKNIGLELDASYLIGGATRTENTLYETNGSTTYIVQQTVDSRANMFRLNPSLILSLDLEKLNPYARLGAIFSWGSATTTVHENIQLSGGGGSSVGDTEWDFSGVKGFGYTSALGLAFRSQGGFCDFFVELSHVSLGAAPEKGEVVKATFNGMSYLSSLSTYDRQIEFVDKIQVGGSTNANSPQKALKEKSGFDSIGFNIGILIRMN